MKSTIFLGLSVLLLGACQTKKQAVSVVAETKSTYMPAAAQMESALKRWPGTTAENLLAGHSIYTNKCNQCHGNFDVAQFSEKKWLHEIDDMSPKANLTDTEKLNLTKYLLSLRDTKVVSTQ